MIHWKIRRRHSGRERMNAISSFKWYGVKMTCVTRHTEACAALWTIREGYHREGVEMFRRADSYKVLRGVKLPDRRCI